MKCIILLIFFHFRVRKQNLGFFESFYINNSKGKHTIETSICRIGVLICNEIRSDSLIDELWSEDPDIILIPFCYCHPPSTSICSLIRFILLLNRFHAFTNHFLFSCLIDCMLCFVSFHPTHEQKSSFR